MASKPSKSDNTDKSAKTEEKKPYTIIDVNQPGKSPADAASKPVIVSNRPILKDPMVKEEAVAASAEDAKDESSSLMDHAKQIKIQPIDQDEAESEVKVEKKDAKDSKKTIAEIAAEADAKAEEKTSDDPAVSDKSTDPDDEQTEEASKPAEPEAAPEATSTEPEETLDANGDKLDPKAAEEARKAAEKQVALEKMAEAGTYSLPINAVEKRRVKRVAFITIAILVLLGLAWTDLALDAQLITVNGITAPTNFFPDR